MILLFLIILAIYSLYYAAKSMTKSRENNRGVVWGLTFRIFLSILCFIVVMVAYYLGYLVPGDSVRYLQSNIPVVEKGE